MAIRRFSTASISTGNSKSTKLWDQETFQSGMFALATVSLASSASSVAFSDIPSNYTHLQIRSLTRTDRAVTYTSNIIRFNGDTTNSNYSQHELFGNGSSLSAGGGGSSAIYTLVPGSSTTANVFEGDIIDILDYCNTSKNKTVRILSGYDGNGSGVAFFGSGSWMNTNAVTSITMTATSGNFIANSYFALYGIRTA
jgi:hypothetical protein